MFGSLVAVVVTAAACTTAEDPVAGPDEATVSSAEAGTERQAGGPVELEPVAQSPQVEVPSALVDPADPDLPQPAVDVERIRSGGPPPDGIPAIDEPRFEPASGVTWLDEREPVLALDLRRTHEPTPCRCSPGTR